MSQTEDHIRLNLPAWHKYLGVLGICITTMLEEGVADLATLAYNMRLAVHEACANVIDHAYEDNGGRIEISLTVDNRNRTFIAELQDSGRSFDPQEMQWPPPVSWRTESSQNGLAYVLVDIPEPDLEQERGRGLFLMRQLMDEIVYYPQPGNNRWRLVKNF